MVSLDSSVNSSFESFRLVKDRIEGRIDPFVVSYNTLPIHIKKWYLQLLQNNWFFILKEAKVYLNKKYKEELFLFYEEKIKNKYPVSNTKSDYIRLEDFNDFFKKMGLLITFIKITYHFL